MPKSPTYREKLTAWAAHLRELATLLEPGAERDALLEKVRQAEEAMHFEEWVNSPTTS